MVGGVHLLSPYVVQRYGEDLTHNLYTCFTPLHHTSFFAIRAPAVVHQRCKKEGVKKMSEMHRRCKVRGSILLCNPFGVSGQFCWQSSSMQVNSTPCAVHLLYTEGRCIFLRCKESAPPLHRRCISPFHFFLRCIVNEQRLTSSPFHYSCHD